VHVVKGSGQAKFWLADCSLAENVGFADHELTRIAQEGPIGPRPVPEGLK
jgi:hypothetical protein